MGVGWGSRSDLFNPQNDYLLWGWRGGGSRGDVLSQRTEGSQEKCTQKKRRKKNSFTITVRDCV